MYRYLTFDGVALPVLMPVDDLSTAQSESAIAQVLNGNVDVLGTTRAKNKVQTLEYTGLYKIDTSNEGFLVDQTGDNLATEDGYLLWTGSQMIETIDGWRRRRGQRGVLVRQRDIDGTQHWKYARLSNVEIKRSVDQAGVVLPMRFTFEVADDRWRAMTPTVVTSSLAASASSLLSVVINSLITIEDPIITITTNNPGSNIDAIEIYNSGNQHLLWSSLVSPYAYNPVSPGYSITFNCETFNVSGGLGYIGFSLHSTHAVENWIEFTPGLNAMIFTLTGGPAQLTISYYEQVR